jgi:hypothetical protein
VHVNAVGTAVDLRSAKFYEVQKFFFDGGGFEMFFQANMACRAFGEYLL